MQAHYNKELEQSRCLFIELLLKCELSAKNFNETVGAGEPWLIDSFAVALAKQGHRFKAKVAPQIADAGYCSIKKLYYLTLRNT
jgi:hypothetical protein